MKVKLITGPSVEPVTYAEMEYHMRLTTISGDLSEETTYVESLITTARTYIEEMLGRKLIYQTWEYYLDEFPSEDYIELPFPTLSGVNYIKYIDTDEDATEFSSDDYLVDTDSTIGRVVLGYNKTYPTITLSPKNPIQIRFDCGYSATASGVPEPIKQAMKLMVADLYENRENVFAAPGLSIHILKTIDNLLGPYKVWWGEY